MLTDFPSVPFLDPPRPRQTLRHFRRHDKNAWRLLQALIWQWIEGAALNGTSISGKSRTDKSAEE